MLIPGTQATVQLTPKCGLFSRLLSPLLRSFFVSVLLPFLKSEVSYWSLTVPQNTFYSLLWLCKTSVKRFLRKLGFFFLYPIDN